MKQKTKQTLAFTGVCALELLAICIGIYVILLAAGFKYITTLQYGTSLILFVGGLIALGLVAIQSILLNGNSSTFQDDDTQTQQEE